MLSNLIDLRERRNIANSLFYSLIWNCRFNQNKSYGVQRTEQFFDSRLFISTKIFLKKLLWKFVLHIFTLLLASFTAKLFNYSRHSESLKYNWKSTNRCYALSMKIVVDFGILSNDLRVNVPRIIDQFGHKRCQKL